MKIEHLKKALKTASKVYVWVPLNEDKGVYLDIAKVSLSEYLSFSEDDFSDDEEIHAYLDDELNLYVGMSYEDE